MSKPEPDLTRTGIDPKRIVWIDNLLTTVHLMAWAVVLGIGFMVGWIFRGMIPVQ